MWPNPQGTVDLVTFTEEVLNGKLNISVWRENMNRTRDTRGSIGGVKHLMYKNKKALNIPLRTASRLPPLDVVMNKPFKNHFRELFEKNIALHKKWSFPLGISTVNVTKSAGDCGFGYIYWRSTQWKTSFFVQYWLYPWYVGKWNVVN